MSYEIGRLFDELQVDIRFKYPIMLFKYRQW